MDKDLWESVIIWLAFIFFVVVVCEGHRSHIKRRNCVKLNVKSGSFFSGDKAIDKCLSLWRRYRLSVLNKINILAIKGNKRGELLSRKGLVLWLTCEINRKGLVSRKFTGSNWMIRSEMSLLNDFMGFIFQEKEPHFNSPTKCYRMTRFHIQTVQ